LSCLCTCMLWRTGAHQRTGTEQQRLRLRGWDALAPLCRSGAQRAGSASESAREPQPRTATGGGAQQLRVRGRPALAADPAPALRRWR